MKKDVALRAQDQRRRDAVEIEQAEVARRLTHIFKARTEGCNSTVTGNG